MAYFSAGLKHTSIRAGPLAGCLSAAWSAFSPKQHDVENSTLPPPMMAAATASTWLFLL